MNDSSSDDPPDSVSQKVLVGLLAPAVGDTTAQDVVAHAARELGIPNGALDHEQALAVLDRVAHTPGLVGISARFVKSRLILKWGVG